LSLKSNSYLIEKLKVLNVNSSLIRVITDRAKMVEHAEQLVKLVNTNAYALQDILEEIARQ
jgi:hypothetical protein